MKYLSLFSGIGGFEVAMPKEWECVGYSEIDKFAIQVYEKHFPGHKNWGDITKIDIEKLPNFDLLVGGFPCQDLSIAKKDRKGLKGDRSGLFYNIVEILKIKKPKYFLLENVASMSKESKQIITDILGVEPVMINAGLVSAQNRKRLFWCNWKVEQPEDRGIYLKDILEDGETIKEKAYCLTVNQKDFINDFIKRKQGNYVFREKNYCISSTQKHATLTEEKSSPLTAAAGMGGGHIPFIFNKTIRISHINKDRQGNRIYDIKGKSVCLQTTNGEFYLINDETKTGLYAVKEATKKGYAIVRYGDSIDMAQPNSKTRRGRVKKGKTGALMTSNSYYIVLKDYVRKLTPVECERLQCFKDDFTESLSNSQRYKTLGNAVNVEVVRHIIKQIPKNNLIKK